MLITPYLQLKVVPSLDPAEIANLYAIDAAFGAQLTVNTATLSAGTVTVLNATVPTTSASRIVFGRTTAGGTIGTVGCVLNAGTSIVFTSSSSSDTSIISYQVVNAPAAFVSGSEPVFIADPSQDVQTSPAKFTSY